MHHRHRENLRSFQVFRKIEYRATFLHCATLILSVDTYSLRALTEHLSQFEFPSELMFIGVARLTGFYSSSLTNLN